MSAPGRVQATVATFEEATRSGSVLLDDGVRLVFGADALIGTGLRLLRPGQRVTLQLDTADTEHPVPVVLRVQILTLP